MTSPPPNKRRRGEDSDSDLEMMEDIEDAEDDTPRKSTRSRRRSSRLADSDSEVGSEGYKVIYNVIVY